MSQKYEAGVTGFTERSAESITRTPARTLGTIAVRPPVRAGDSFGLAVLGRDQYQVGLQEVVSTDEVSVFLAEAGNGDGYAREVAIEVIAERIARIANSPTETVEMLDENPFPRPSVGPPMY